PVPDRPHVLRDPVRRLPPRQRPVHRRRGRPHRPGPRQGLLPQRPPPHPRPAPPHPLTHRSHVAILLAMAIAKQMPLADVKNRLSEVVDEVEREHGRVVITKHGRPAAVVLSVEDLESLEETLDVMGSAGVLGDIREALAELETSGATVLSKDDAL